MSKNRSGLNIAYAYQNNTNQLGCVNVNSIDWCFSYDYKGNVTNQENKGISNINYDRRNLILNFVKNGNTNYYRYDDNGNRIYKSIYSQPGEYYLRDHTGRELAIYNVNTNRLKMLNLYGLPTISVGNGLIGRVDVNWIPDSICVEEIPGQPCTWEYYDRREDDRFYYFKDHLGSIHMTLDENSNIVSAQDYYPYGEILRSYTTGADINSKYKPACRTGRFTEKERDTETNYDYFGARYYDSELARWLSVDPMSSSRPWLSPYNYCQNNPLIYFDPDGMLDTKYEDEEGNLLAETNDGNDASVVIPDEKKDEFLDEYNSTSVMYRDGSETNAAWIQKYGGMMYAEEGTNVQDWAISSIGISTAGLGAAILNETYGHTSFRIYNSKGFSPKIYNGWAGNQYVNTLRASKVLKGAGFIAGFVGAYQSIDNLASGKTSGVKGWAEVGIGMAGWLGGAYGAAISLGYEVGKLHPLKLIGIDATRWFK